MHMPLIPVKRLLIPLSQNFFPEPSFLPHSSFHLATLD